MVYSFLATVESDAGITLDGRSTSHSDSGYGNGTDKETRKSMLKGEWKWCSKTDIQGMNLPPDRQKMLMAVLKLVENNVSQSFRLTVYLGDTLPTIDRSGGGK